jgi:predicted HTH domain antitoxin
MDGCQKKHGQTLNNRVILQTTMATIEIDEEVYEALRIPEAERPQAMKEELAVSLYARDVLSFGKARALAELSPREFQDLLGDRKIPRHYTEAELAEDLEYAD